MNQLTMLHTEAVKLKIPDFSAYVSLFLRYNIGGCIQNYDGFALYTYI